MQHNNTLPLLVHCVLAITLTLILLLPSFLLPSLLQQALVVSGTELPGFVNITNPTKREPLKIKISIGSDEIITQRVEWRNGVCGWNGVFVLVCV